MNTRVFLTFAILSAWAPRAFCDLIENDRQLDTHVEYPSTVVEPFEIKEAIQLDTTDVKPVQQNIHTLEKIVETMAQKTYVPYVWGGSRVGSINECNACVACLHKRSEGLEANASRDACLSCERCGIDCSNLAHEIFAQAHLEYPYLTSKSMAGDPHDTLEEKYNLVDMGSNLRRARFGDLIVQESHVLIFLSLDASKEALSYLHSSRRGEDERPFGGINVVRGRPIESLQPTVVRILRHRQLVEPQVYSVGIVKNDTFRPQVN